MLFCSWSCHDSPVESGVRKNAEERCKVASASNLIRRLNKDDTMMTRRDTLKTLGVLAGTLGRAAERLPANKNVKWGLGSNLWNSFKGSKFTDILDVMRDTGFISLRLTQFPKILETYNITTEQMEKEVSKRGLHVVTISFNGPAQDASK